METKKKLGTGAIIGIVVLTILSIVGLISYIISSFKYYSGVHLFVEFIPIAVLFIAVAYYAAYGYKKPHGDLLRFVFLLFSARNFIAIISDVLFLSEQGLMDAASVSATLWGIILRGISIVLIAYVGGRLDKVKKNIVPLAIVLASHVANLLIWVISNQLELDLFVIFYCSTSFIFCIDLIVAYVLRYHDHKEAGLADKK